MAHQPWTKFYFRDWDADAELASCSLAAQGLWMRMLRVMHEAQPYGFFVARDGGAIDLKAFARRVAPFAEVKRLVSELESAGVFSRDGQRIYSRRMVRDEAKRTRNQANGSQGGNPTLLGLDIGITEPGASRLTENADSRLTDTPTDSDKAQKPEARVQSNLVRFAHSIFGGDPENGLTPDDPPWLVPIVSAFAAIATVELRDLAVEQRVVVSRVFAVLAAGYARDEAKNQAKALRFVPAFARIGASPRLGDLTSRQFAVYAWRWRQVVGKPYHSPFDVEAAIEYEPVKR